ncbi:uncharacterized protein LOC121137172 isoform X2 [Mesocricetus auratus]|uniref:Uncharacterized protein LOC121137172 isoform X2 n=1 Tax=Mesocricetus auratus TaxID=10036 RepID=A0ABM2X2J2_MESAU|nr:uncharacterized protein LOC121137172 isoform X2 [Mesocricetus auratus]
MKALLLSALACLVSATEEPLACLVSATEEPLPFSGQFNTIYLASKIRSVTDENSEFRMLMHEVNYFKNYTCMSIKYHIRKNGKCQLHKVWAENFNLLDCYKKYNFINRRPIKYIFHDRAASDKVNNVKCPQRNGTENIIGTWRFTESYRHFSRIYYYPETQGGLHRIPSDFYIVIHFASNTTILLEASFINDLAYHQTLTAALDACPKLEQ